MARSLPYERIVRATLASLVMASFLGACYAGDPGDPSDDQLALSLAGKDARSLSLIPELCDGVKVRSLTFRAADDDEGTNDRVVWRLRATKPSVLPQVITIGTTPSGFSASGAGVSPRSGILLVVMDASNGTTAVSFKVREASTILVLDSDGSKSAASTFRRDARRGCS